MPDPIVTPPESGWLLGAGGLGAGAMFLVRMAYGAWRGLKADGAADKRTEAERDVIEVQQRQIDRMEARLKAQEERIDALARRLDGALDERNQAVAKAAGLELEVQRLEGELARRTVENAELWLRLQGSPQGANETAA